MITDWLPGVSNAFLQKKDTSCVGGNERVYLAILPCTLGGKPTIYKEMGIYFAGLTQPQSEYRVATTTTIMGDAGSSNPGGNTNMYILDETSGNNDTSPLGAITNNTIDAMTKMASPLDPVTLSDIYNSADVSTGQDLSSFLSRPFLMSNGVLSSTDGATPVFSFSLFYDILTQDVYKSKIKGFMGFKATTVFTLQVNATRFQQGRYFLAFVPVGGVHNAPSSVDAFALVHTASLKQWTQLPHVEIDINCDTQATIRIPYFSSEAFYPLNVITRPPGEDFFGYVMCRAYSPVVAVSGPTTVAYSLYVHFEDIEVCGPTMAQSNFKPKGKGTASEKEIASDRTLSTVLLQGSKAAGVLARIPVISSFASTASWALDIASSAAWAFGFAKPTNIETVCKMQTFRQPFMNNVDGANNILPLSLQTKYGVEPLPGFAGNNFDEMSIDYLKTILSYQYPVTWTSGSISGTNLLLVNITPVNDDLTFVEGANTFHNYGIMGLLGNQFRNWRGSITWRIKIVKTEFHSGRLLVSYCPTDPRWPLLTANFANQAYLMKRIIDIRETNEFTITFPYVQTKNYLANDMAMGTVTIDVLDQLQAPATVSSSISLLIEIGAGPDFEVFNPLPIKLLPYLPASPHSAWSPPGCIEDSTVIGDSVVRVNDNHARACVGEKITSLRQLCKFWGYMATDPVVAGSTKISYSPFINPSCSYNVVTPVQGGNLADWIAILSHGFTLSRGSVVIGGFNADLITGIAQKYDITIVPNVTADTTDLFAYTLPLTPDYRGKPFNSWDYNQAGFFGFNCPAWSKTLSRCVAHCYESSNPLSRLTSTLPDYRVTVAASASGTWTTFRSAGEDFTLGGFIGLGPYYIHA